MHPCHHLLPALLDSGPTPEPFVAWAGATEEPPPTPEEIAAEVQHVLTLPSTARLGRHLGLGPEDVEDAAANSLLPLLRHRDRIVPAGLRAYVHRSVRNAIKDFARVKWRRGCRSLTGREDEGDIDVLAPDHSPLDILADRDLLECVLEQIQAGSEQQKQIVKLRLAGWTHAEIAREVGLSVTTVWREWERRIEAARELLG
jgi:RNA polymerase sigma factor (sigma-70 family)